MPELPDVQIEVTDVFAELRRIVGDAPVELAIERVSHRATRAQLAAALGTAEDAAPADGASD